MAEYSDRGLLFCQSKNERNRAVAQLKKLGDGPICVCGRTMVHIVWEKKMFKKYDIKIEMLGVDN